MKTSLHDHKGVNFRYQRRLYRNRTVKTICLFRTLNPTGLLKSSREKLTVQSVSQAQRPSDRSSEKSEIPRSFQPGALRNNCCSALFWCKHKDFGSTADVCCRFSCTCRMWNVAHSFVSGSIAMTTNFVARRSHASCELWALRSVEVGLRLMVKTQVKSFRACLDAHHHVESCCACAYPFLMSMLQT